MVNFHRLAWSEMDGEKKNQASCFKVQPTISSNLIGSGLCGWLVLCWFIADHAWCVSLEKQIATDMNCRTASVYQTASKIVACWYRRELTTVLYHKAPVCWHMIGYWSRHIKLWLAYGDVNHRGGLSLTATQRLVLPFWFSTPLVEHCFWPTVDGRFPATSVRSLIGCFLIIWDAIGRTVHELKQQRPLVTEDTPLWPCCFAVYASDWFAYCCWSYLEISDWWDSHAFL